MFQIKKMAGVAILAALALGAQPTAGLGAHAAPQRAAIFAWSMPSRFGTAIGGQGRVVESRPDQVTRGPWQVNLRVTGPACARGATYSWTVDGRKVVPRAVKRCRFAYAFRDEGPHRVRLDAVADGAHMRQSRRVVVQDLLIVSIGDSVASGEAVPDVADAGHAIWQSVRCHRSARAGVALAAREIEEDDNHSSVTFVHLACSGATVPAGLTGPYGGAEPPPGQPPLEPQLDVLERIAARRPVDAVLVSIGANDIHFGDVVRFCAAIPAEDCFTQTLPVYFGGDGVLTVEGAIRKSLGELGSHYDALARRLSRISPRIPPSHVHIVDYFDPTHDAGGHICDQILGGVNRHELELAGSRMLAPLNREIAAAAAKHGWDEVSGVAQLFRDHGYCAGDQAWVTTLTHSVEGLGGTLKGRLLGTLHPNRAGHEATSNLISAALERAFFPGRTFPPRPEPRPTDSAGTPFLDGVAALALLLLSGFTGLLFLATSAVWIGLVAGLWFFRESGSLIMLGFAAGASVLVFSSTFAPAATPIKALARTFRPLLLPLLVVVVVGTAKFSPLAQILVSAAVLVLAWRLIVEPEAVGTSWGTIAICGMVAIVVGATAVALASLLGVHNAYLETIGNFASGLLLLALALWTLALMLRLLDHATTRLRSLLSFVIGLGLGLFAMAFGIAPGGADLHDAWPILLGVFGVTALLLLVLDGLLLTIQGPPVEPGAEAPGLAGRLGFSTAMAAALVLAVSTGYSLVDAAGNGHPLNPPDNVSAAARIPSAAATAGARGIELAEEFSPVLVLGDGERWAPSRVGPYLDHAHLLGPGGVRTKLSADAKLPTSCSEFGEEHCYRITIECESGHLPCAHETDHAHGHLYREGAAYVRIIHRGHLPPYEPQEAFAGSDPYGDRLATLIQYWYFYYYDEWEAPVFAGLLTQRHESDWEAVTIGLTKDRLPLFVADSAHCAGSWRPWGDIEVSTLSRVPGPHIHPLVAVAEGSHANYPEATQSRSPDWAHCKGAPEGAATAVSFASNIRDKTDYGWLWYPPPHGWIRVNSATPPMDFPGNWGADESTTLHNFQENHLATGGGPLTPSLQPLWREPVRTIFCGKYTPQDCPAAG